MVESGRMVSALAQVQVRVRIAEQMPGIAQLGTAEVVRSRALVAVAAGIAEAVPGIVLPALVREVWFGMSAHLSIQVTDITAFAPGVIDTLEALAQVKVGRLEGDHGCAAVRDVEAS